MLTHDPDATTVTRLGSPVGKLAGFYAQRSVTITGEAVPLPVN